MAKQSSKTRDKDSPAEPSQQYRVLARKYRPQVFSDLIGQDAVVTTLTNAFKSGRIAQAYMLTGVRGVGKTTTARLIARALNYSLSDAPSIDMSEEGEHCQAILESRHVDVVEMDAASHTGIDDVREIIEAVRYRPASARYKVYIIDEVHMLSRQAFNGLLKTLEEPPAHVKFIFATTEVRKVPVTVLSRCQRFDLRRVDGELLCEHFRKIGDAEGVSIDQPALALIARVSEGSVRDGLSLLDQAIAGGRAGIDLEQIRDMLGLVDKTQVIELFDHLMSGTPDAALTIFSDLYGAGGDPVQIVQDIADFVHLVTRVKVAGGAFKDPALSQAELSKAQEFAGRLDMRVLARAWQLLLKGIAETGAAGNPKAAADMVFVRMAHMADLPTPDEVIERLDAGGVPPGGEQAPAAARTAPVAVPQPDVGTGVPADPPPHTAAPVAEGQLAVMPAPDPDTPPGNPPLASFGDVVSLVGEKRDVKLKQALEHAAHLVAFRPGHIELRFDEHVSGRLANELGRKLSQWTAERWIVVLSRERGQPTIAARRAETHDARLAQAHQDPLVIAALEQFPDATIEEVRDSFEGIAVDSGEEPDEMV